MGSTPQTRTGIISPDQRRLLAQALKFDGADDGATRTQRVLIRELCSSPQVRALPPERFVISMKETLNHVAEDARVPLGRQREDLLFRLLTISIEEFFQTHADGDGDGDGSLPKDSVRRSSPRPRVVGSARKPHDDECRGSR